MKKIFVNLKRFDIPQIYGGICTEKDPAEWIRKMIDQTAEAEFGRISDVQVVYMLPESLLIPASDMLRAKPQEQIRNFQLGCQNVYREDVAAGANFGAFTTNRPAAAMSALGIKWAMVGHSEERRDKLSLMAAYDPSIDSDENAYNKALGAVGKILNEEAVCALKRKMNILLCIGETAEQKGSDIPEIYEPRVKETLKKQICEGLKGTDTFLRNGKIVIAYEPIWAIGPGKTPASGEYVAFVSSYIKEVCREEFGVEFPVVYGGGLKEENAAEMASVTSLDGGLVALTKFTPPVAFDVGGLKRIIEAYLY